MLQPNTDKDWEKVGRLAPYFGVHSEERFLPENLDESRVKEFFALGEQEVGEVVEAIERHLKPEFAPVRCLDFGCGVGRLVFPLARRFQSVVGVDVSRSMIEEARRNSRKYGIENAEFLETDEELSTVSGKFDFILSYIVMQHLPPWRGEQFLRTLIGFLSPGGVASLHFTYSSEEWLRSHTPWRKFSRWIRGSVPGAHKLISLIKRPQKRYPFMRMTDYDLNRLFSIVQEHGCKYVHAEFTNHGGHRGVKLLFLKDR